MRNNLEINKNVFIAAEWRLGWGSKKHLAVTLKGAVIHGKEYNGEFYAIQEPRDTPDGGSCAPYFDTYEESPIYELTESAAKVLAAFTMKYAPPLVQLLTPEKIEEQLEEERQRLNRAAALEVVGYGQEMRLN